MSARARIHGARHWRSGEAVDVVIINGVIEAVAPAGALPEQPDEASFHAEGAVLAPGLVDLHVHLREPGQGAKETIATGTRAAAAGGFTDVACMPNTNPVLDEPARIEWVRNRAREAGHCRVHVIGTVTVGQLGEQLAPLMALRDAGAVAFSDDGHPIMSAEMMRRALEYLRPTGCPIVCHEEDLTLRGRGHMNEGAVSARLGIRGIPPQAESIMVRRDVELAELTGGRVHLAHLSTERSFDGLRDAKRRGLAVTGETCPHYWMLTDEAVEGYDTFAKMNPPLRGETDRQATVAAIVDGTIDCFATDHAPHTVEEKAQAFDQAPFGIVGLETALALTITGLVRPGHLTLERALESWTDGPRRVFGLPRVAVEVGSPADLVLFDPDAEWTVEPGRFHSKGRNTPFAGRTVTGRVLATWRAGDLTHIDPERERRLSVGNRSRVGAN